MSSTNKPKWDRRPSGFFRCKRQIDLRFRLDSSTAHQAAGFRILTYVIKGRNRVPRRQRSRANQEPRRLYCGQALQTQPRSWAVFGLNDHYILRHVLGRRESRIDKKANMHGGWNQFVQQAELL
jgi:hypothetical protein